MTSNGPEGFTNRLGITFHPELDLPQRQDEQAERQRIMSDAFTYIFTVKERFKDSVSQYTQFLDVMKDYRNDAIDVHCAMRRILVLLHGHTDLILGLQVFLPPGYRFERHTAAGPRGRDTFSIITPFGDSTLRE
ncbi:hypothetical protein SCHPADRAFT_904456 [Schizopora paradoxa]|uniref:PAH2 domain-containing protein n=1 Tax=Schizopora paradoxa TaxID=27342 RepID=A0A0H2RNG4_9AGAM|nr:hypothetical protein SCHPADRAFT_904456 [Schizopora paradoxa]